MKGIYRLDGDCFHSRSHMQTARAHYARFEHRATARVSSNLRPLAHCAQSCSIRMQMVAADVDIRKSGGMVGSRTILSKSATPSKLLLVRIQLLISCRIFRRPERHIAALVRCHGSANHLNSMSEGAYGSADDSWFVISSRCSRLLRLVSHTGEESQHC